MTVSLKFYADAQLTQELPGLTYARADDGSSSADDRVIYLGSTDVGITFTNNAGGNITVAPYDSAIGSGVPASAVKLATSSLGLNTAVAGDPVSLGASIQSGAAHAVPIYVRVQTAALAKGSYADLALRTSVVKDA